MRIVQIALRYTVSQGKAIFKYGFTHNVCAYLLILSNFKRKVGII